LRRSYIEHIYAPVWHETAKEYTLNVTVYMLRNLTQQIILENVAVAMHCNLKDA